ncbi:hypothetical protein NIES4072_07100 [Nostoc commune NIES-4072]|uniref:Uncharacterized protein n=1 Tax=Nostoc commune NIES-4072 TaxID=2005467 RepID=A0A2R5FMP6_NOSCO|nr:hypothetical protein NIES4070_19730 [Nostoc commune HK-02]GBG17061.1 hypothetical protein NIES4072_07100 [Nostoc commune NIES-4072]
MHLVRSDRIASKEMIKTISKLYLLRKVDEPNEFNLLPLSNSEKVSNPNSFLYPLLLCLLFNPPISLKSHLVLLPFPKLQSTNQGDG